MFDVLKRYLLIVWNFFFGQTASESIQDRPKDQPEDLVPPVEVGDEAVKEEEEDGVDVKDILDGEEEDSEEEEEEEDEEDEREEADQDYIPKKPENKIVVNDVPTKPNDTASRVQDVKVPADVPPKTKDAVETKGSELSKADADNKEKEKEKPKSDVTDKSEIPKLKPEFEVIEKESPKVVPKVKSDFEVVERGAGTRTPDASELKPEFEIVERDVPKASPVADKPAAETTKGKEVAPAKAPEKQVAPASKPHEVVGGGGGVKEAAAKGVVPEKSAKTNHVKFEDDDDDVIEKAPLPKDSPDVVPKPSPRSSPVPDRKPAGFPRDANNEFVALEKGGANNQTAAADVAAGGPQKTDNPIDAFITGEQRHTGRLLQPESIQDQQLEYSDSGEELSDDDIEIDYEDDEDDEEVEEVKPLPPVARSVYKKND